MKCNNYIKKNLGLRFHFEISDSIELSGVEIKRVTCIQKQVMKDCLAKTHLPEYTYQMVLGKTVIPVSARFKELAQHPPHKRFDM